MNDANIRPVLSGQRALIVGVANGQSIAYGCAKAFRSVGAVDEAGEKAPLGELVDIMDVGFTCVYFATSLARRITGGTVYVDGGAKIVA